MCFLSHTPTHSCFSCSLCWLRFSLPLGPRITMLICSALSPLSLPTHNKDLVVQAENHWIEPVGFVAQGWRQAIWQEVVQAGGAAAAPGETQQSCCTGMEAATKQSGVR